jgi:hypothetical protein
VIRGDHWQPHLEFPLLESGPGPLKEICLLTFKLAFTPITLLSMAEQSVPVPRHPVALRMTNGPKKPHVGPDIDAYRQANYWSAI